jgi:PAT family beta-lactamase induction signal transducer AmpG
MAVADPGIDSPPVRPRRRTLPEVLRALSRPKVAIMLVLGFSSGLPFMLIGNTLGFWLAEDGVKLAVIGFTSWIGLTYTVKFLWGAVVDRVRPPLLGRLGRRRGWMIATQLGVGAGLIGMSLVDPRLHIGGLIAFGLLTGVSAAAQDTVIDAWRIESAADPDELGLLTAAYSLGFRIALIATEAWILLAATAVGWPTAYVIYGGLMGLGVAASVLAREPTQADVVMEVRDSSVRRHPLAGVADAVVGPFVAFFKAHGAAAAALMLGTITLYHLCDYLRGPMSNPYYLALGIHKPQIAYVRTTLGLAGSFAGIALGGWSALRLGNRTSLIVGAILQPLAVAAFAILGFHRSDFDLIAVGSLHLTAFATVMTCDSIVMAYSGVALVAFMSTLTSLGYTATQYALLTSALTWTGKTLKGFSGAIVEGLQHGRTLLDAYALFYLLSAAVGLPAILLCLMASRRPSAVR